MRRTLPKEQAMIDLGRISQETKGAYEVLEEAGQELRCE